MTAGAALTLLLAPFFHAAGQTTCVACHPSQAKPQPSTSMGHALETAADCDILQTHPRLTFKSGRYSYLIERKGTESIYSVSDGQNSFSVPIRWAFGQGFVGQTYVYENGGELYQTRVSYYREIGGLDYTLGAWNQRSPSSVAVAAGQLMSHEEKVQCFRCHATGTVDGSARSLAQLTPGVHCERCHGPATQHVEAVKQGNAKLAAMKKLGALTSEETANFCGQCHRTWEQIAGEGITGVLNVRFQPYRLTNSKCYDADDARIRCTSCHDPHQEVNRVDASYDSQCLACHTAGGKAGAGICKISRQDCVSCHMPKVEIPGSHHKFTDHNIRIAKANAPYPD